MSYTDNVRSREDIINGLLSRAFNGQSRFGGVAELRQEIDRRLNRAREMPDGHKALLQLIRSVEKDNQDYRQALVEAGVAEKDIAPESRALRNLSIRERMNGQAGLSYQTAPPQGQNGNSLLCEDVTETLLVPRYVCTLHCP